MSFAKLLATGKSLVGMSDNASRYRMRTQNLLPKFGSPKNPFAQPAAKAAAPVTPATSAARMETASLFAGEGAKTEAARDIEVNMAGGNEPVKVEIRRKETKAESPKAEISPLMQISYVTNTGIKLEAKTPTTPARVWNDAPSPAKPVRKTVSWFGLIKKLNPLAILPWGHAGGMASRGRVGRSPVQTELSLDRVQVVRNDLRDTDLEIVPGRLMGMPSGASPVLMNSARPDTKGWSRLATHLWGMEQTQI